MASCELAALHIRPNLGTIKLQVLRTSRIESFYGDLADGRAPGGAMGARPLAAATIALIHRLVVQILGIAVRDGLLQSNPAILAKRLKIEPAEIEILSADQVREVLRKLRGRWIYRFAALGLSTGMRRGEICALRWKDVDLDGGSLRVEQSLEQTKAGLRFKRPKTRYSARTISLPTSIVAALRALRREQSEDRLRLGLGRDPDEALVFRKVDGAPLIPNSVTTEWRRLVQVLRLPKVSLHAWRHTHASQLIDSGMDVLTISRRLGHSSPSITLNIYGHRFSRKDEGAAGVFDTAFAAVFTETKADERSTNSEADGGKTVAKGPGLL